MSANALRQLPRVLAATCAVVMIPLLLVKGAAAATGLSSPLLSIGAVVVLSFVVASAGAAYWSRRPGSRDMVFGDLMLWGWLRRIRTERRLAEVCRLLGLGRSGHSVLDTKLSQAQQTKLLERLGSSLEALDPHTHGHTQRVTRHATMIAQRMGLSEDEVVKVRTGAALHDVGKLDTPRKVLNKPAKLTDAEFEVIKRHPVSGGEMVAQLGDAEMTAIVRHHHERIDGQGYPDRLSGTGIPIGARIIAVADTFDAVTSSRPYRRALSHREALQILKNEAGSQLDADAVAAFLSYYSGSRSASRWTFFLNVPERIAATVREGIHTTAAAPMAKNAVAVAATAVLGSSLAAPIAAGMQGKPAHRSAAHAGVVGTADATGVTKIRVGAARAAMLRTARRAQMKHDAGPPGNSGPGQPETAGQRPARVGGPGPDVREQPGPKTEAGAGKGKPKDKDSSAKPGHAGKPDKVAKPTPPGHGSTPPGQDKQEDKKASPPATDLPAGPPPNQGNGNDKDKAKDKDK